MFSHVDHTFAVCAYKESPYLEQCLSSLLHQSVKSNVFVATATPNSYIKKICATFDVPLFIHDAEPGIASDWNFAISCASTSLVTIAHQDDTYESDYVSRMLAAVNSVDKPLLYFTNYGELRDSGREDDTGLLRVKRALLFPLKFRLTKDLRFIRRRALSFGNCICCPSVTFVMPYLTLPIFVEGMKSNLDWDAWERISRLRGGFLYDHKVLMHHRIHGESETTALIRDNTRSKEDRAMFERFWPRPIAGIINMLYALSEKSNELE